MILDNNLISDKMFVNVKEIDDEILYYSDVEVLIGLLKVSKRIREIVHDKILTLINNSNGPVEILSSLIDADEEDLAKSVINKIYSSGKCFLLSFERIVKNNNLSMIEMFFANTPADYKWHLSCHSYIRQTSVTASSKFITYHKNLLLILIKTKQVEFIATIISHVTGFDRPEDQMIVEEQLGILIEIGRIMVAKNRLKQLLQNNQNSYEDLLKLI